MGAASIDRRYPDAAIACMVSWLVRHRGPNELLGLLHPRLPYRDLNRRFSTHTGMPVWCLSRQPGAVIPAPAGDPPGRGREGRVLYAHCSTRPQPVARGSVPPSGEVALGGPSAGGTPGSGRANHRIADTLPLHKRVERPILRASLVHFTMVVRKRWRPCATVLIIGSGNAVHNLRMLRN
jgi:hypothetical protein